jgi:hypothetical protein
LTIPVRQESQFFSKIWKSDRNDRNSFASYRNCQPRASGYQIREKGRGGREEIGERRRERGRVEAGEGRGDE